MARPSARARRMKLLLALEITRLLRDLEERLDFLVTVWSRHRTRVAFTDTLFSRYRTLQATDLVLLEEDALTLVETFYDELESLRQYLLYTEDMPRTLEEVLAVRLRRLRLRAMPAIDVLGGAPDRPAPLGPPTLVVADPGDAGG